MRSGSRDVVPLQSLQTGLRASIVSRAFGISLASGSLTGQLFDRSGWACCRVAANALAEVAEVEAWAKSLQARTWTMIRIDQIDL